MSFIGEWSLIVILMDREWMRAEKIIFTSQPWIRFVFHPGFAFHLPFNDCFRKNFRRRFFSEWTARALWFCFASLPTRYRIQQLFKVVEIEKEILLCQSEGIFFKRGFSLVEILSRSKFRLNDFCCDFFLIQTLYFQIFKSLNCQIKIFHHPTQIIKSYFTGSSASNF